MVGAFLWIGTLTLDYICRYPSRNIKFEKLKAPAFVACWFFISMVAILLFEVFAYAVPVLEHIRFANARLLPLAFVAFLYRQLSQSN